MASAKDRVSVETNRTAVTTCTLGLLFQRIANYRQLRNIDRIVKPRKYNKRRFDDARFNSSAGTYPLCVRRALPSRAMIKSLE
jgi:hypothetical protein